jgi:hypothetical protein
MFLLDAAVAILVNSFRVGFLPRAGQKQYHHGQTVSPGRNQRRPKKRKEKLS